MHEAAAELRHLICLFLGDETIGDGLFQSGGVGCLFGGIQFFNSDA
ncbi:MAG: hypothetical protein H6669_19220 [Ardenticatenaceae bacterium]|nr:hypothetical protein [Ardenticatenaceae bacterium]